MAGTMAIVVGIFLCWRLRDRPQAIGLPPIGDWRHDELEIAQQQEGAGLTRKEILTKYVLFNPYIWLLSLCYVLVYVVRAAINDWGNLYMSETLGVNLVTAQYRRDHVRTGRVYRRAGGGWGSDKLFNGNRGPMNLIFCRRDFALRRVAVADAVCQLCDAGGVLLHHRILRFWPADADWHGSGGMFAQRGGRCCYRVCWAVRLSRRVALRLAAGEGDGSLALDRLFCGDRHRGGDFCTAAAAVLKRSGAARSVTRLTFLRRMT
ncbi:Regulatory protein uhpC [Kluyvera cryocrescens]|uniref:Regulatory protein uhpC n=1 Tax=Kluyvera cryocrescens TaxID=580 RepID=A0A485B6U7_KLUCR|nr:Regulatory protein uhpC [Kluyvera cryocrescens]